MPWQLQRIEMNAPSTALEGTGSRLSAVVLGQAAGRAPEVQFPLRSFGGGAALLTRSARMGRKSGNEPVRKLGLGSHQPSIEPTPEKGRISQPSPMFSVRGPNGSTRPLATETPSPGVPSALAPGIILTVLESPKDAVIGGTHLHHTHHLHTTTTHHYLRVCREKALETRDFGVMLASTAMMIPRAI